MIGVATRIILKQAKGVTLVKATLRSNWRAAAKMTYTVTAYWSPTHFYDGDNINAAEEAFERSLARAPLRALAN